MRPLAAWLAAALIAGSAASAAAQAPVRPPPKPKHERIRLMIDAGLQSSGKAITETQTFQQYQEQGSFTMDRTVPRRPFYDGGVAFWLFRGLSVGGSVSYISDKGTGAVTAQVPHPFFFNQPRTTTGTATGIDRKETAVHIQALWTARAAGGIEFTAFGGPSFFQIQQGLATTLNLTLANEVYPYDTLAFPGIATETVKKTVNGYNAGVDMTWRLSTHVGLGAIIRYSHGRNDFTPTGLKPVPIEAGGLHAGGGLRVIF